MHRPNKRYKQLLQNYEIQVVSHFICPATSATHNSMSILQAGCQKGKVAIAHQTNIHSIKLILSQESIIIIDYCAIDRLLHDRAIVA